MKKYNRGKAGVIWLIVIVLVVVLGCIGIYMLQNNKTNDNVAGNVESKAINSKEETIKVLSKALLSHSWVKENLYLKKDAFGNDIKESEVDRQNVTFKVVRDKETKDATVVVKVQLKESIGEKLYLLTVTNGNVNVINVTENVIHPDHNTILANSYNFAVEYGHMGSWEYTMYSVSNGKLIKEKTDKGTSNNSKDEYKELDELKEKNNLKEISVSLSKTNLEKHLK